jgi:diguanylate cyclase (GGDEF)-like protein
VLDKLLELGADDVIFDIDFSVPSVEAEDAAFAAALEQAGGYAYLAAFAQRRSGTDILDFNLPIDRFLKVADPAAVNVTVEQDGLVRTYPSAVAIGGRVVPSAASILAGQGIPRGGMFNIDFSIDPRAIDRISVGDLLGGTVDPQRIAGKHVIVGASAVELRDFFVVPRFGAIPGALLQALAGETLLQGRALHEASPYIPLVAILALGLLALIFRRRAMLVAAIGTAILASAGAELAALLLQQQMALLLGTAAIHIASAALVLSAVLAELVRRGELALRTAGERDTIRRILDRVIADNFDGVIVVNGDDRIVAASRSAETILGRSLTTQPAADVLPDAFRALLARASSGQTQSGELKLRSGEETRVLDYVVTYSDVTVGRARSAIVALTFRDITARRAAEDRLTYLGTHDVLTGTFSRNRLVELIDAAGTEGRHISVVVLDLRRFRVINDTLGHGQGDLLLRQAGSRLLSMGPEALARLGSDTFALLLPFADSDRVLAFCTSAVRWLALPYKLADDHQATIAAAAGATTTLLSGGDASTLLAHADMALSTAKLRRGNGVALFTPDMDQRLKDRQTMDGALRRALAERQFTLAYQPQVDLTVGKVTGAEALARWQHASLGPISPLEFIPAAEETGLIVELGRWALHAACADAARWPEHLSVAVNISPVQFELSNVVADVAAALDSTGLDPRRLEVEITEGIFVTNAERVSQDLDALRGLGVRVALDDFGTGYSSLSYLGRLPIDKIKIDQSFVKRLPGDAEAAAIVNAVVLLSQTLGKAVLAEGLETVDQAWILKMMGCKAGQGFHLGRPMTNRDFLAFLDRADTELRALARA